MTRTIPAARFSALVGAVLATAALVLMSREGRAERAPQCGNTTSSLCQQIERCEPSGFESNMTCRWNYSVTRYYWRN